MSLQVCNYYIQLPALVVFWFEMSVCSIFLFLFKKIVNLFSDCLLVCYLATLAYLFIDNFFSTVKINKNMPVCCACYSNCNSSFAIDCLVQTKSLFLFPYDKHVFVWLINHLEIFINYAFCAFILYHKSSTIWSFRRSFFWFYHEMSFIMIMILLQNIFRYSIHMFVCVDNVFFSPRKPSVVVWLFALAFELSRGGPQHRIRGLFERALANDKVHCSVLLWRWYIAYEVYIACSPSTARRIFFRAIHACPW